MNIWVNGCFDILHTGHIDLLRHAKNYQPGSVPSILDSTNKLYVGLDTDERVKRLKGDKRPINDINTRITIMRNLRMVDEVFMFDTDDELRQLVKILNIHYMVVGDQYWNKEVIGSENAKFGVVFYPVDSRSTTSVVKKIQLEVYEDMYEKFKNENDANSINFTIFAIDNIKKLK